MTPDNFSSLGFFLIVPKDQIEIDYFPEIKSESIKRKVQQRVAEHPAADDLATWHQRTFLPLLSHIRIESLSWESLIQLIGVKDAAFAEEVGLFYRDCLKFNRKTMPNSAMVNGF
jgi:hypothetical protein